MILSLFRFQRPDDDSFIGYQTFRLSEAISYGQAHGLRVVQVTMVERSRATIADYGQDPGGIAPPFEENGILDVGSDVPGGGAAR